MKHFVMLTGYIDQSKFENLTRDITTVYCEITLGQTLHQNIDVRVTGDAIFRPAATLRSQLPLKTVQWMNRIHWTLLVFCCVYITQPVAQDAYTE